MRPELTPEVVAARLEALRQLYVPERCADAARRLERERPKIAEPFEHAVARRLSELRALCELASYLHRAELPTRGKPG